MQPTSARMTAQGSATWRSGSRIAAQGMDGANDLRYNSLLVLSTEWSFGIARPPSGSKGLGLRLGVQVLNILDRRPRVSGTSGPLPVTLQPGILDPLGRIIGLSIKAII